MDITKFLKWFVTYILWLGMFSVLYCFKVKFEIIVFSGMAAIIAYIIENRDIR